MPMFTRKPAELEARQVSCLGDAEKIADWIDKENGFSGAFVILEGSKTIGVCLGSGNGTAFIGDWVIYEEGVFRICAESVFAGKYTPVQ